MTASLWTAPSADGPVCAVVEVPGSKSVTNRALVLAALSAAPARLHRPLRSRDTLLMAAGLRAVGVRVEDVDAGDDASWLVDGTGAGPGPGSQVRVDAGNAGTVARFLPPVAALTRSDVRLDGDPRMRERPLGPLLTALRELGVDIADDGSLSLPVTVRGRGRVRGGTVTVDASSSSQLVSGLLLSAPRYDAGLVLRHHGPPMPSSPHVAMTVAMLRAAGAVVDDTTPSAWEVRPGPLDAGDVVIEPDLSSAAPFLAAALATGGTVQIPRWPAQSTQPGALLPGLLERMGGQCRFDGGGLTVSAGTALEGLDADLRDCGELTPVLVALAALARSPSRFRGVAHLRLQETDRLAALAREIGGLGGSVRETEDGLDVRPRPLHGGTFATYADHRLAMAASVIGLAVPGVLVEDIGTTVKTVPGFAARWTAMVAGPTAPVEVPA